MEEKKEMSTEEIKMDNDPKGEGKEKASSPLREVLSWVVTLLAAFALMFIREDMEQNPLIEKDISAIRKETAEIDRTLKQELKEEHRELKENATHKR